MKGLVIGIVVFLVSIVVVVVALVLISVGNQSRNDTESTATATEGSSLRDRYAKKKASNTATVPPLSAFQSLKGTVGLWFNAKGDVRVTKEGDMVMLLGKDSSVDMKVDRKNYGSGEVLMTIPIAWSNNLSLSAHINVPGLLGEVFVDTEKHQLRKMDIGWYEMNVPINWDHITQNNHDLTVTIILMNNKTQARLYMLPAYEF